VFPARLAAQAPPAPRIYRIGWLGTTHTDSIWEPFVEGLRERGWIEGRNVAFERLYSEGRNDRFPALAAQMVQRDVDLMVTVGTPPTVAARDATTTIPIVFFSVGDPVGSGLVASFARPGRNLTGMGGLGTGLHVKALELLKDVVPKALRIAMFVNDAFPPHAVLRAEVEPAARRLGVTLVPVQVRVPEDIDIAFATIARDRIDALFILGDPLIHAERVRVAKLALDHRMPAISPFDIATEAGVLMSYGGRLVDDARRVPHYVDRILKGTKPAELPVEQPIRFYLWINLRTAAAIGVTVPPSTLARADQVFQ
jgi:putative tryptophan/tyrosine transport system substrate-binding protein